ncbi:MAG: tetratricopeptide repeat protein [Beijerinckiaceae bacterium]
MRVLTFVTTTLLTAILCGPLEAQQPRQQPAPPAPAAPQEPQRRSPDVRHQSRVDQLFERLAASRNEAEAEGFSEQINRVWARSGSDTLDLLLDRSKQALAGKDAVLALDLIDSILALKPDWPEAYNRRAAIHFQRKDMDAAMRDLRQTLALEPRHFQALAGIGMIFQQGGNTKQALAAFREALKINPHLKGVKQSAEKMAVDHDGQNI